MLHVLFANIIDILHFLTQAKPNCYKIEHDFQGEQQSPKYFDDLDAYLVSYFRKYHRKGENEDRTDYVVDKKHAGHFLHTLLQLNSFVIKDALGKGITLDLKLDRFGKRIISLDFGTKNVFQGIDLLRQQNIFQLFPFLFSLLDLASLLAEPQRPSAYIIGTDRFRRYLAIGKFIKISFPQRLNSQGFFSRLNLSMISFPWLDFLVVCDQSFGLYLFG